MYLGWIARSASQHVDLIGAGQIVSLDKPEAASVGWHSQNGCVASRQDASSRVFECARVALLQAEKQVR